MRDAVWGDIELGERELALIDTPAFQRLRRVRQLGFTDLVFPGAHHTRFEHWQVASDWFSYEPVRSGDASDAALTAGTVAIRHISDRDRHGLGAHLVFPNLMVATAAEFVATYEAIPLAPDRTRIVLRVRAEADADAESLSASVQSFIREDIHACEQVQAAMASPAFAVGPLAVEHEAPITALHRNILAAVGA